MRYPLHQGRIPRVSVVLTTQGKQQIWYEAKDKMLCSNHKITYHSLTSWMSGSSFHGRTPSESASARMPSQDGTASLDLGSAEYCSRRCTFSAELICTATKMGSLLPSSRLDGLALCCSNSNTIVSSPDLRASHSGDTSGIPKSCGEQQAQSKAGIVLGNSYS